MSKNTFIKLWDNFFNNSNSGERLFFGAYGLCLFSATMGQTMFAIPSSILAMCKLLALGLIALKILAFDSYKPFTLFICIGILADTVLIALSTGHLNPLVWAMILIGTKDVSFDKIVKFYLTETTSIVLLAFIASFLGVIVNLQYTKIGVDATAIRNSFGIIYPTDFAAFIFFILLSAFYLMREHLKIYHYIGTLIISLIVYYLCQTRLDCISMALMVCMFALINARKNCHSRLKNKYRKTDLISRYGALFMPASALFMSALTLAYSPSAPFLDFLNELLSSRLHLGKQGFEQYGIKLFGQVIPMVGNGGSLRSAGTYFFIDCSYLFVLLQYGLLFLLVVIFVYIACCYKCRSDHYYIITVILISINCMIAHHLIDIEYNPFAFALFAYMGHSPYASSPIGHGNSPANRQAVKGVFSFKKGLVSTAPSLKLNFIMNSILSVTSIIFPVITFPYVSRILGSEKIGTVSFATSVISYFSIFAQLGIPVYGIRACSQVRDDREKLSETFSEIFFINIITCAISYLFFFIALLFIPRMQEIYPLLIISSLSILLNTLGVQWLYQGLEKYTYITVCSLIFKLISLAMLFLLVRQSEDYLLYTVIHILASSGSCLLNFLTLRRNIHFVSLSKLHLSRHIKPICIFFAMSASITIYTNLDIVMLGFMKSDLDVGYYSTAVKIKSLTTAFVTSLGTVLLPRASFYLSRGEIDSFMKISQKAFHFVILLSSPLLIYFALYAQESIRLIAGAGYDGSVRPMIIIAPTILFIGLTNITGMQMLVPMGREKTVMYSTFLGAVVDIIVNLLLIPNYSSSGAAIGTLIAEFAVLVFQTWALKEKLLSFYCQIPFRPIVLALIISSFLSFFSKLLDLSTLGTLALSSSVFFGTYLVILNLLREPLTLELEHQLFHRSKL